MTEAAVSFAGNLTDQPELRHTGGGIARAKFRVAVSGPPGGRGRGSAPAAELDREDGDTEFWAASGRLGICGRPLLDWSPKVERARGEPPPGGGSDAEQHAGASTTWVRQPSQ
jgi:hypothetical protein